jgi:hypothetical protein
MEPVSLDLDGQVALVTGASRGIGHDLALAPAAAGARAVAGVRKRGEAPSGLEAVELDLETSARSAPRCTRCARRFSSTTPAWARTTTPSTQPKDEWDELLSVNLK